MNFVTLEFIRECMVRNNVSCWNIYDERKKRLDHYQEAKAAPADSFSVLKNTLDNLTGEFVNIRITKNKTEGARAGTIKGVAFSYYYALKKNAVTEIMPPAREMVNDAAPGSYGFTIIQQLQEQNAVLREQILTQTFNAKLEALSAQLNAPAESSKIDKVLDLVLVKFLSGMNTEAAQVVTPVPDTINGPQTTAAAPRDTKEKLTTALNDLKSVDENFIETISKVAKLAKDNPALFKEYIKNL